MKMYQRSLVTLIIIVVMCIGVKCIYFAHRNPEMCLHVPSTTGSLVGKVYAYTHAYDACYSEDGSRDVITYEIPGTNDKFSINSSGWILLKTNVTTTKTGSDKFDVIALCKTYDNNIASNKTTVIVNYHNEDTNQISDLNNVSNTKTIPMSTIEHICFSHVDENSMFVVEENAIDVVIGRLNTCLDDKKYARTYTVEKPKSRFRIDPISSEVTLIKPLDRETSGINKSHPNTSNGVQPLRITCQVEINNEIYTSDIYRINVTVLDVNDNPPVFYPNGSQEMTYNIELQPLNIAQKTPVIKDNGTAMIRDVDSSQNNTTHAVKIVTDPLHVCKPELLCYQHIGQSLCKIEIHLQNIDAIVDTLYKCKIAVVDRPVLQLEDISKENSATLIVNIQKRDVLAPTAMPLTSTKSVIFYRNATKLARLMQLGPGRGAYYTRDPIFNVTTREGIIFVRNMTALASAIDDYQLIVYQQNGATSNVHVKMYGTGRTAAQLIDCEESCSRHESARTCKGSCGYGVQGQGCQMRGNERNSKMNKLYATCTYDTDTCPDLQCDELEDMYPLLCPQDCIYKGDVNGAFVAQHIGRGIAMAKGTCWCDYYDADDIACSCMSRDLEEPYMPSSPHTEVDDIQLLSGTSAPTPTETTQANETDLADVKALTEQPRTCDNTCEVAIGVGLTVFVLIAFSLFMLWFTKKKDDRRKTNMKHVGSVVSLSGLPSDYQDERERRTSYSSDSWSPKGPLIYSTQMPPVHDDNSRWEIPRESLHLEKTLGEGEFGLVVKARLAQTDGDLKFKNVAVKMLKHCSTQLEEQDLWSEYNLLKDISHPNVIRLLGACTTDGPFYLVVEFCEQGCLLKYLRRSRLEESGYVNSGIRFKSPNVKEQTDPDLNGDLLSMRDLLSFSWQIAKGMCYLSEIKLVHRDLAARNILVASGKVLKISDFGLTRDVYEADTYLKKSKGRIPVKWLAPESLYAQIYTTRSDIWSYGIVLWEIVTLGAPPYPGIPPERLYNLLIGGYRMDRPENCPDEMYAVMQKCWKVDAADRPSFATLASIFDRILQEKTGYLDLSRPDVNVSELYNKCFSQEKEGHRNVRDSIASNKETADDNVATISNLFTVCNETYCTDNYLEPTPSKFHTEVSGTEHLPSFTESHVNGFHDDNGNSDENSRPEIQNNDTINSTVNVMNEINNTVDDKRHIKPGTNITEPMFKKKTDGSSLPTTRYTKNKHVIFPSENVSLLTETGNARYLKDGENTTTDILQC